MSHAAAPIDPNAGLKKIIAVVSSDQGDTGTTFFRAAILALNDQLRASIEKAYRIVLEDDAIAEVRVHCSVDAVAGGDHMDYADLGLSEDDEDALDTLAQSLEDEGGRGATQEELAIFSRALAHGVGQSVILVKKYAAPQLMVREKYGYEEFTSPGICMLEPPSQVEFHQANRIQNERFQQKHDAHLAAAQASAHV